MAVKIITKQYNNFTFYSSPKRLEEKQTNDSVMYILPETIAVFYNAHPKSSYIFS